MSMDNAWYCHVNGEEYGPLTPEGLRGMEGAWVPANRVKGLFDRVGTASGMKMPAGDDYAMAPPPLPLAARVAAPVTAARPVAAVAAPAPAMLAIRSINDCISDEERK